MCNALVTISFLLFFKGKNNDVLAKNKHKNKVRGFTVYPTVAHKFGLFSSYFSRLSNSQSTTVKQTVNFCTVLDNTLE
jgi:hypothetical protein